MGYRTWITLSCLVACCVSAYASPVQKMTKASVLAKSCRCQSKHGNILATFADASQTRLTTNGLSSACRVSPDGMMCGWLTGEHVDSRKYGYVYVPDKLLLYKGGKIVRSMQGKGDYPGVICRWQFWGVGRQVALAVGSVRRGTEWYELRDIATADLLDIKRRWTDEVPSWAKAIAESD